MSSPLGKRIVVVGPTNSGKSTMAQRISQTTGFPFVELDALFWKPGWVASTDDEWHPRIHEVAHSGHWIVAGNYWRHTNSVLWPRAETIVWLDLPLRVTLPRVFERSWRRWRSREVLWGTNRERFWPLFKVWDPNSLLRLAFAQRSIRERYAGAMSDPAFAHIRWIRLRSTAEVEAFARSIEEAATSA